MVQEVLERHHSRLVKVKSSWAFAIVMQASVLNLQPDGMEVIST
jgi:hypothetical protein